MRDTQRLWGIGRGECPDAHPDRLSDFTVLEVRDDETVWGGFHTYHYGHFLAESVARLWPLLPGGPLAGKPVVFSTPARPQFIADWENAFGLNVVPLPADDVVEFSRLRVPEPAWRMGGWIAPELRDLHQHARGQLPVDQLPTESSGKVLWLSRTKLESNRRVQDEALCQWLLGDHIRVMYPETMGLTQQLSEIESSRGVVGPVGSAFHTLLLVHDIPDCIYLSPSTVSSSFIAQDQLLAAPSRYVHALANTQMSTAAQDKRPYRLLIPETLRALDHTLLNGLLKDKRMARMAFPERAWSTPTDRRPTDPDLDTRVLRVLLDPNRIDYRMDLGARFEEQNLVECAIEQFSIVTDIAPDYFYAALRAARALSRNNRPDDAALFAKRVLTIEPHSKEAQDYVEATVNGLVAPSDGPSSSD